MFTKKTSLVVALILFLATYMVVKPPSTCQFAGSYQKINVKAPGRDLDLALADKETLKRKGLSSHRCLLPGTGMLFVYDTPGKYGFWMKDMQISIDIVWVSAEKKVIGIEHDVSPKTYPKTFIPPSDAQFVIEIAANSSEKYGLTLGSNILW